MAGSVIGRIGRTRELAVTGFGRYVGSPMTSASRFTNPSTGTTYRLVQEPDGWRITKSREDDGRLRLVHLRGVAGTEPVDAAAVARLVAGSGGIVLLPTDPAATFAAIILHDLESTTNVLTAIARDAYEVCEAGCRGFRPRSPVLKKQRDAATARAVTECRKMAEAWRVSGLVAGKPLPTWLTAALGDEG
jgi:hypothetical protein